MHHYPHHIGDFDKNTRHLSRIERCIYRDMMDLYYAKERPLLADEAALFRLLLIRDPDEVAAARQILAEFFELTEAGWVNDRCEREIAIYHKGNQAAAAGGRAKAWKAVDKAIRVHVRAGQAGDARGLLIDFVSRHGHDDDTRAVDEMISSLERDAHQAQVQLDLIGQAALDAAIRAASAHSMAEAGEHSAGTQHEEVPHLAGSVPAACAQSASSLRAPANQNQNQNQNQNHQPPPSTLSEEPRVTAVELSIEFRKWGVKTQPADPRLIAFAKQGVDRATVAAACAEARRTLPDGPLAFGYVKGVLERWAREANAVAVSGAQAPGGPKRQGAVSRDESRRATIAGLTGGRGSEPDDNIIDITPAVPASAYRLG